MNLQNLVKKVMELEKATNFEETKKVISNLQEQVKSLTERLEALEKRKKKE